MSVEHYQRVISLLAEAALVVTSSGGLLAVNQAAASLLGTSTTSINGNCFQSYTGSSETALLSYLRHCSRSRQLIVGAVELITPDGKRAFTAKGAVLEPRTSEREPIVLLRLFPKWESSSRFQALKEQIDELNLEVAKRLRAEYEIRAQKKWLEVTLASIGDAVITTDIQGAVAFMNPIAEEMTAWTQEEAIGKPLKDVFVVINEYSRDPVENPAEKALREGQVVALANHSVLIAKNGIEISIEDTAAPIALDGETKGAILVFHDVSNRKHMEKQLMKRAETLELANRRKNQFLTMLAHELRSPLAPISNAVEIMSMQPDKPESFNEPQQVIARQVQHLKRLIDDMLDVSRITRGKMNVALKTIDVASLVRSACTDYQAQFSHAGITSESSVPRSPIWVSADSHRLTQVLHNILINSIKFTPPGGSVHTSLTVDNEFIKLQITDTGIGVEKSLIPDLFEPFTQADQSLDRRSGGLGLGLSLVKGIIDLHNGHVAATSDGTHKGTTITIRLPLAEADEEPVSVARYAGTARTHCILLIEDEEDAATTMSQLLELLGHDVHIADTGPGGLAKAEAILPSLIICDIGLPGLDGFAVARQLRNNALTSAIPLVALTGYGDKAFINRAKRAGFDHHITKPATISDLQQVMAKDYD